MSKSNGEQSGSEVISLRPIIIGLIVLAVVVPLAAGITVAVTEVPIDRLTMEFRLGTWPNQEYPGLTAKNFRDDTALAVGVGLRAFMVIGIPAILGVGIALLLRNVERRLERMNMRDYIGYRDRFIKSHLLGTFQEPLVKAGLMEAATFNELVKEALELADGQWRDAEAEALATAIERIELPDPQQQ